MAKKRGLRIGTRSSALALSQANWVKSQLEERYPEIKVSLIKIKTKGDKILDVPLAKVGGKGLFVKEIEEALLSKKADIAVHSIKDVPTEFPDRLQLTAITEREDPRDVLISKGGIKLKDFKKGARVGTSSLRRQAQLLRYRPDINIVSIRGNLGTRISKLNTENLDAIVLASAGLIRMGLSTRVTEFLSPHICLPAIGQGALGIETEIENDWANQVVSFLGHQKTFVAVSAERAFLKRLEGGCQVPIAAYGEVSKEKLTLRGLVGSIDGKKIIEDEIEGDPEDYTILGVKLAEKLLKKGAKKILDEVYGSQ